MGGQSLRKIQNPQEHAMGRDESNGGTKARVSRRFKIPLILRNVSKSTNEMATKEKRFYILVLPSTQVWDRP
jgi:hypothetical protein